MDSNVENADQSFNAAPVVASEASKTSTSSASTALAPAAASEKPAAAPDSPESAKEVKPAKPGETAQDPAGAKPEEAAKQGQEQPATAAAATEPPAAQDAAEPADAAQPKKQTGLLASFFGAGQPTKKVAGEQVAMATPDAPAAKPEAKKQLATSAKQAEELPQLSFENIAPLGEKTGRAGARLNQTPEIKSVRASAFADDGEGTGLPGVRQSALFEIKRKSGIDDDSDVDIHEGSDGGVDVAFAPGLARLSPNGLLKQRESVDVACLKPSLVRVLKTIERRFGKKVLVTSGYRSPNYNRKVRGAKNSQHMYCAAADIHVPGVSKWEVANFARSMPGRGGVGTYCHTAAIHVDVGPERDWNWRCRGRKT